MNWGMIMHMGFAAYLFVIFLWVMNAMQRLTKAERHIKQLQWSLEQYKYLHPEDPVVLPLSGTISFPDHNEEKGHD